MREPGYYWIWDKHNLRWHVVEWDGENWYYPGIEEIFKPDEIAESELGPKIEPPPER